MLDGPPRFDPLFPAHAIERCGITIMFAEALPEKAFSRILDKARDVLGRKGFRSIAPVQGININLNTGQTAPMMGGGIPQAFILPDQSASLWVSQNSIVWQNSRYVRWAPYFGQFRDLVSPVLLSFLDTVSPSAIRLEYWDRFNWSGSWDDFDARQLIRADAKWIARGWDAWPKEWHSHAGWFEAVDKLRRLTNVNVDIGPYVGLRPSVLVYTMMQDEPNAAGYGSIEVKLLDETFVYSRLEMIHRDIKAKLADVIADEMVARISLASE